MEEEQEEICAQLDVLRMGSASTWPNVPLAWRGGRRFDVSAPRDRGSNHLRKCGDEINPDILRDPGWKTIRSRIAATTATSATTTPVADPNKPKQKQQQHRKKPTTPPEEPLPPSDFMVVIRPQGGLDLSKTNAAQLADCIFNKTKITNFAQGQVRINTRSSFIVVSTPDERRAQQYLDLKAINWNATHYPVQSHIPPSSITTPRAIVQSPSEDSEPLIMESLTRHSPTATVFNSCRIKNTGIAQVLLLGPHVPFWVRKHAVILRCYPYKRKTEACMACVCPETSLKPHCTICGTMGPTPNNPCKPRCNLCGRDHLTASPHPTENPTQHTPRPPIPPGSDLTASLRPLAHPDSPTAKPLRARYAQLCSQLPQFTHPHPRPPHGRTKCAKCARKFSSFVTLSPFFAKMINAYKRKPVFLNNNFKPPTTLQSRHPIN
ncbi:hypothetical protein HPB47_021059 [Ixodes persulcatus]|uniref:Uncharacterized protein n=1 Tax=Ixodes persulcatus TaxID=34615 RepID=A0AC60QH83_IXOPE|nr:hypothetical protein HPB47_021059 [Ixodes persulcatus]